MVTLYVYLTSVVLAAVIWGVRQEGRINTQEKVLEERDAAQDQKVEDLKELINARFDASDHRLSRIERALNGQMKE